VVRNELCELEAIHWLLCEKKLISQGVLALSKVLERESSQA
jgi:hypothetical protein